MHFAHLTNTLLKDEDGEDGADINVSLGSVATYAKCGEVLISI